MIISMVKIKGLLHSGEYKCKYLHCCFLFITRTKLWLFCPYRSKSYLQVWVWHGDVVVLSLVLGEQFEPATDRTPEDLTHSEWQRSHEIVPRRAVPVPYLHRQPPVPLGTAHWAGETNTKAQNHWGGDSSLCKQQNNAQRQKENVVFLIFSPLWHQVSKTIFSISVLKNIRKMQT